MATQHQVSDLHQSNAREKHSSVRNLVNTTCGTLVEDYLKEDPNYPPKHPESDTFDFLLTSMVSGPTFSMNLIRPALQSIQSAHGFEAAYWVNDHLHELVGHCPPVLEDDELLKFRKEVKDSHEDDQELEFDVVTHEHTGVSYTDEFSAYSHLAVKAFLDNNPTQTLTGVGESSEPEPNLPPGFL